MNDESMVFKALSDPLRLRLMALLVGGDEICVCRLAEAVEEPQFKVSKHLALLKAADLVFARRQGTWMYYQCVKPKTIFVKALFELVSSKLSSKQYAQDKKRLLHSTC